MIIRQVLETMPETSLTLVAPGLCARPAEALAATPALRAFARHARAPVQTGDGLHAALFAALGLDRATPVAALAASGAGADVGDAYVLAATPVLLTAGHDDVFIAACAADIDASDAQALVALLNRHFAEDGLAFFAPVPARWYARMARTPELATTPLDVALRRPMLPHLPGGAEGRTWQRWQDEIQMLLHAHAAEAARGTSGAPPVNAVWFWGGGRLADAAPVADLVAAAASGEIGDALRGLARRAGRTADPLPRDLSALLARMTAPARGAVALPGIETDGALAEFGAAWLAPAVDALERGRLDVLQLVADGHGAAVTWRAARPTAFARMTSRFRAPAFRVPAAPEP